MRKNKNLWENSFKLRIWDKTDSKRFAIKIYKSIGIFLLIKNIPDQHLGFALLLMKVT